MAFGAELINVTARTVQRSLEKELRTAERRAEKAAFRALKKSLKAGRTQASKELRDYWNLKKKYVDKYIYIRKLNSKTLSGELHVSGRTIPLIDFMTTAQINTERAKGRIRRGKSGRVLRRSAGVSLKAYRKQKKQVYPGTFIATAGRSGDGVYKRTTPQRTPIEFQRTDENLNAPLIRGFAQYERVIIDTLEKNMERELNFEFEVRRG